MTGQITNIELRKTYCGSIERMQQLRGVGTEKAQCSTGSDPQQVTASTEPGKSTLGIGRLATEFRLNGNRGVMRSVYGRFCLLKDSAELLSHTAQVRGQLARHVWGVPVFFKISTGSKTEFSDSPDSHQILGVQVRRLQVFKQ
jgi:hypothetical protein